MVFVDTSAWFAFFLPVDRDHQRVHTWFASSNDRLVTSDYIVDETLTLLLARRELGRAREAGRLFFEVDVARVHFISVEQVHRAWVLFQQRASSGWSFTDCTSKIVIDDLGIPAAVALDDHFCQFGVEVLPAR